MHSLIEKAIARPIRRWMPLLGALCLLVAMAPAASAQTYKADGGESIPSGHHVRTTTVGGKSPSGADCNNYFMPVKLHPDDSTVYEVWGQLCSRGPTAGKPVQLLMSGGGYTHAYWDWPRKPGTYSYVDDATRQGQVTLNLDRIGYGNSDHPNPVTLDFQTGAYVAHQVVQYLRNGKLGTAFDTVITNAHSMGAMVAEWEAAKYNDVDGLIVSGWGHNLNVKGPLYPFTPNIVPAKLDQNFVDKPWLPGYITTKRGSRCFVFHHEGDVSPGNCRVEEQTKGTMTATEIASVVPASEGGKVTNKIDVPVLWAMGVHDKLWCADTGDCTTSPTNSRESRYWDTPGQLTQFIVPNSGHSINVGYSAPLFYQKTFQWLAENNLT